MATGGASGRQVATATISPSLLCMAKVLIVPLTYQADRASSLGRDHAKCHIVDDHRISAHVAYWSGIVRSPMAVTINLRSEVERSKG